MVRLCPISSSYFQFQFTGLENVCIPPHNQSHTHNAPVKIKKKLLFSSLPPYQTAIAGHVWHERVMLEEPSSSSHVLSAACPSSSAVRPPADPRRRM